MSSKQKVWIPAIITIGAALVLLAYYFSLDMPHNRPDFRGKGEEGGKLFTTLGTVALYVAALAFSWLWFKKNRKSPSRFVQSVGKKLHRLHQWLGWAALAFGAAHGVYLLLTRSDDHKIWSGIASFAILLAIVGYGVFIPRIRNKWMRSVHRLLGIAWVPIGFIHAGGSMLLAAVLTIAIGVLVRVMESFARRAGKPIND
ncbi:hypothetical protein DFQ01_11877 [Paenibacillus cellulosilyticus]|uniref:Ferric reductase like protein n=1 Tax=Paenibacillus cellulosilyticus TaxID=375489 RepID=A0A2V2YYQ4_9BACL|nr:hypothetical protein [Paenibacillus cellulosilyticus]PWV98442.1 hypothetical protein DFQ01_11877 [Paenibacillus cellulosilyticus]QKS43286.1 hypothetical protein HUB94_02100 [Paenibacillus cellulosilyticus]